MPAVDYLDFRTHDVGGDIDATTPWGDSERLRGREHLVLLLHGYNNTRAAANSAYSAFFALQQNLAGPGKDWAPGATVVSVYWPGDADWGLLSPAYYPWAVPRADDIAGILGAILSNLGAYSSSRLALDFVAHSLGNRLLLRTLALCGSSPRLWIRRVVHMAAAVPTWKLEDPQAPDRLIDGLKSETAPEGDTLSLYSHQDTVLRFAFPLGETASPTHEGFFPTALGHEEWAGGHNVAGFSQLEAHGANHGDYWGLSGTPATLQQFVSRMVQRELDLGASVDRNSPVAYALSRRTGSTKDALTPRLLSARASVTRVVGGDGAA